MSIGETVNRLRRATPAFRAVAAAAALAVAAAGGPARAQSPEGLPVIRDAEIHAAVGAEVAETVAALGWSVLGLMASPILGRDGNREFLLGAKRD